MRSELMRLKRDTDSSRQMPVVSSDASSGPGSGAHASSASHAAGGSGVVAVAKQHKFSLGVVSLVAVLLVAVGGYGIYALLSRSRPAPFQNFSVSKVTETGESGGVAISPDGKYILSVLVDNNQRSLWLRNIPTNSNTQVVAPSSASYIGPRFSPDGNYLYFVRQDIGSNSFRYLYRAPVLGGTPEKLVTDIDTMCRSLPTARRSSSRPETPPSPASIGSRSTRWNPEKKSSWPQVR